MSWSKYKYNNLTNYGKIGLLAYIASIILFIGSFAVGEIFKSNSGLIPIAMLFSSALIGGFGLHRLVQKDRGILKDNPRSFIKD